MANVLITGMTAPQSSRSLNARSLSFTGAVSLILEDAGHSVNWIEPSVFLSKKDLRDYDVILLGIAPLLSITSSKAYGVLHMINVLSKDSRVRYLIDSPEPARITFNLRAVQRDYSQLTKEFYRLRKHYREAVDNETINKSIAAGVNHLTASEWPTTVYPAMPWSIDAEVAAKMPENAGTSLVGIHADAFLVEEKISRIDSQKIRRWLIDTDKTKWSTSTTSSLRFPHTPMKTRRSSTDTDVFEDISSSIGTLLSPSIDGLVWWSYRWAQSMNAMTPIASDWKVTGSIGNAWSHLAAGIEEMSYIDMYELSVSQKAEYLDSLPSRGTVKQTLETSLGIEK